MERKRLHSFLSLEKKIHLLFVFPLDKERMWMCVYLLLSTRQHYNPYFKKCDLNHMFEDMI